MSRLHCVYPGVTITSEIGGLLNDIAQAAITNIVIGLNTKNIQNKQVTFYFGGISQPSLMHHRIRFSKDYELTRKKVHEPS